MGKGSFLVCLISLVFLTACVVVVEPPSAEEERWMPRATFEKTVPLGRGAEISLENARGNIEVIGWDEEKVEVRAEEAKETSSSRRLRWSSWRQLELEIEVKTFPRGIRIMTSPDVQKDERRSVHYILRVPRSIQFNRLRNGYGDIRIADLYGQVAVEAREGKITVENFSGTLRVELGRGDIEAEVLDVRPEDEIQMTTEKGQIRLFLEPQAQVRLEVRAPMGNVVSDFDLSADQGDGAKALVSLHTEDGDIWVKKGKE